MRSVDASHRELVGSQIRAAGGVASDDAGWVVMVQDLQYLGTSVGLEGMSRVFGQTAGIARPSRSADIDHNVRNLRTPADLPEPTARVDTPTHMRPEVRSDLPAHHARLPSACDALSSSRTSNSHWFWRAHLRALGLSTRIQRPHFRTARGSTAGCEPSHGRAAAPQGEVRQRLYRGTRPESYLGIRKPDEEIYRLALDVTHRQPEECLLIDDRAVNVECIDRVGIPTIRSHDPAQLKDDLELRGVTV